MTERTEQKQNGGSEQRAEPVADRAFEVKRTIVLSRLAWTFAWLCFGAAVAGSIMANAWMDRADKLRAQLDAVQQIRVDCNADVDVGRVEVWECVDGGGDDVYGWVPRAETTVQWRDQHGRYMCVDMGGGQ